MTAEKRAKRLPDVSVATWVFAIRTWAAMMAALYAAFWLQLPGGSSAAVTVGILATPTRAPSLRKAIFRLGGTAVGVVASIAIAGLFNETRTLFLGSLTAWLACCVFVAGVMDDNRAYAAVLSGYTVAIVAIPNIDSPLLTFESALDRGAAIVLGIAALALVEDILGTPDALPGLRARLARLQAHVRAATAATLRGDDAGPAALAKLCAEVTALRAGALALPAESVAGRVRAAAARRALASLAAEIQEGRALVPASAAPRLRLAAALEAGAPDEAREEDAVPLVAFDAAATDALRTLRNGLGPALGPALPIRHPVPAAARNAARVFATFAIASAFFVVSGWPRTTEGLLHVAIFMCLSATNADPRSYARATVLATALVIATVGVTEFLVLDGVDAFPLLAIGLFPSIVLGAVMKASKGSVASAMGNRVLIFTIVLLSPGLVQSYDAQRYLSDSAVLMAGALLFVAGRIVILPLRPDLHRRWLLDAARADLHRAGAGRAAADGEAAYWWTDLLAQMGRLARTGGPGAEAQLAETVRIADAAWLARRRRGRADRETAAVDRQGVTGGHAGGWREQEEHGLGDLLG